VLFRSLALLIMSGVMIFGSAIWPALKKLVKSRRLASH
jgi:hypothetical protein